MELSFDELPDIAISGIVEVELPSYMTALSPEQVREIMKHEYRSERIVAAGMHPDGYVLILTGDGNLKEFVLNDTSNQYSIWPATLGVALVVSCEDYVFEISSVEVVERSMHLLALSRMGTRIDVTAM